MILPNRLGSLVLVLTAVIAGLLLLDWITSERIGDWAFYAAGAALAFLMVVSLGTVLRSRVARLSSDRLPLDRSSDGAGRNERR